jgi:hypothetical protein
MKKYDMKKIKFYFLTTAVSISLLSGITHAQTNADLKPYLGLKGGVNFSNLYTDKVDDNNVLTSFNAGLIVNFPITKSLSVQPEFIFSRKGSEQTYDNLLTSGTARFKLNYLEVPLLLKVNLAKSFNLHAGPYLAYLIDAGVTNETNSGNFDFEDNISNDDLNKFDYGLSAGLGFDFDAIGIGARYNIGLRNVGKERDFGGITYTIPEGKNSNVSIYLAIKLN